MGTPIEVRELRKSFPVELGVRKRTALDGMSFPVEQGGGCTVFPARRSVVGCRRALG
jgi:hypothetical protein